MVNLKSYLKSLFWQYKICKEAGSSGNSVNRLFGQNKTFKEDGSLGNLVILLFEQSNLYKEEGKEGRQNRFDKKVF